MQDSSFNMDEKKEAFTRPGHVLLEWIRIVFCTALRHLFRTTFLIINMYRAYMCLLLISLFSIGVLSCVGARVLLDGRGEGGLSLPVCLCSCNACNTYGVASYLLGSGFYPILGVKYFFMLILHSQIFEGLKLRAGAL